MRYARGSSKDPSSHRNLHTAKELPKRHCEVHDATASCTVASQGRLSIRGKPGTFVHRLQRPSIATVLAAFRVEDLAMTNQCVMRVVHRKIPLPIGNCIRPQEPPSRHCEVHDATASCAVASQGRSSIRDSVPRLPRSSPLSRRRPRNDKSMRYARGSSTIPSSHRNLQTAKEPPSRHCEAHDATASCAVASQGRLSIRGKPGTFVHPRQARDVRPSATTSLDCRGLRRCRVEDLAMTNQ